MLGRVHVLPESDPSGQATGNFAAGAVHVVQRSMVARALVSPRVQQLLPSEHEHSTLVEREKRAANERPFSMHTVEVERRRRRLQPAAGRR